MSNKVTVKLASDTSDLSAGLSRAQALLKSFAKEGKGALSSIGEGFGVGGGILGLQGLSAAIKRSVQEATNLESLTNALRAVSKEGVDVQARLSELRQVAALPGLGFNEAVRGDVRLQAVGISAGQSKDILLQFGNAIASIGGGKAELDGVVLALGQMAAKGKISAEEINQIAERIPQVRAAIKGAFGTADSETLQSMGISVETFIGGLTAEFAKAPRVVGGLQNSFDNLDDTLATLYQTAGKGIGEGLAPSITALAATIESSKPEIEAFGHALGSVAGAAVSVAPHLKQLLFLYFGYKAIGFLQGIMVAQAAAMRTAAAAATTETTALAANTAAQRANATARRSNAAATLAAPAAAVAAPVGYRSAYQSPYGAKLAAGGGGAAVQQAYQLKQLGNAGADAAAVATAQGTKFGSFFASAAKTSLVANAPTLTLGLSAISTVLLDGSKSIGGQSGKAMIDGISVGLSFLGPQGAIAALGLQFANAGYIIGQELGKKISGGALAYLSEADVDKGQAENARGAKAALDLARQGKGKEAAAALREEISRAQALADSASPPERDNALKTLELLHQQENVIARIAATEGKRRAQAEALAKAAADEAAWRKASAERQQAASALRAQAEKSAGQALGPERDKFAEAQIALKDPKEQIEFWKARVARELGKAKLEYNAQQFASGGKQTTSPATLEGLSALIPDLAKSGRNADALALVKTLNDASAAQEKLTQLQDSEAKKGTKDDKKDDRITTLKAEMQLEAQLDAAKAKAAGEESQAVTALEDQLKVLRLQQQLKDQLGITDKQALELATAKVGAENQITAAIKARQQAEAKKALGSDLALLKAKASGNTKQVAALEREQRTRDEAKRIAADTGATPAVARRVAEQKIKLEDQAESRAQRHRGGEGSGPAEHARRLIRGFSSTGRAIGGGDLSNRFRNLDALAEFNRVRPAAQQAAANVAKQAKADQKEAKQGDATNYAEKLIALLTSLDNKLTIAN